MFVQLIFYFYDPISLLLKKKVGFPKCYIFQSALWGQCANEVLDSE